MLQLKDLKKEYKTNNLTQKALDGVSLNLRDHELVAILGPSGSGKTTLLNIIGGLDRYDSGEMIINGVSTTQYTDRDWDTYRNHSVGFIFQSYNLIPHQSVLANVEIAMTISGISKSERRTRAEEALKKVGLGAHIHKKPNQLSGGQMQRVAIARALVNDPDIILADEPTGALDSETSVQVMNILSDISKDRLVVMVTHNNELAEEYASRIVRIKDGKLLGDTDPFVISEGDAITPPKDYSRKARMNFLTALSLSANNLKSKLGRTILVALAGSIGIIGIAMILSMSNGANRYIQNIEESTVLMYPLTINQNGISFANIMMGNGVQDDETPAEGVVVEQLSTRRYAAGLTTNDLRSLKAYIESPECEIKANAHTIEYSYDITPYIFRVGKDSARRVHPEQVLDEMGMGMTEMSAINLVSFHEMPSNDELYANEYKVLEGRWPENYHECVVVLTPSGRLSDTCLFALGLKPDEELDGIVKDLMNGKNIETDNYVLHSYEYSDFIGKTFKVVNRCNFYDYDKENNIWIAPKMTEKEKLALAKTGEDLTVTGVVCLKDAKSQSTLSSGINYRHDLILHLAEESAKSPIVKQQKADPETNVFTGKPFGEDRGVREDDFMDIFEVDEDAFGDVFSFEDMNTDMPSIDFSGIDISSYMSMLDMSGLNISLPREDILEVLKTVIKKGTGQNARDLVTGLMSGFSSYMGEAYITDPAEVVKYLNAYFASDELKSLFGDFVRNVAAKNMDEEGRIDLENFHIDSEDVEALSESLKTSFAAYISGKILLSPDELKERFSEYLGTDDAKNKINTFVQSLSEAGDGEPSVSDLISKMTGKVIGQVQPQIAAKMGSVLAGLGSDIAGTISSAVSSYIGNLVDAFSFNQDALAEAFSFNLSEEEIMNVISSFISGSSDMYGSNLTKMGYADEANPSSINIYPKDFDSKERITGILSDYNRQMRDNGEKEKVIIYSDLSGTLMSSVGDIVGAVSTVLIGLVAISLVVSSIMISVITHISVLERQKEIGILRAIGASKKNIADVFNAETFITGLFAGVLGIIITLLLIILANFVIHNVINQPDITAYILPFQAILLVALSVALNVISGLIPAYKASKSDPVIALRGE